MRGPASLLVIVLTGALAGSCATDPSYPTGAHPFPSTFQLVTVANLPATCFGQTYFEASTALCPSGVTYLLCGGSSYSQYVCQGPQSGWTLDTNAWDPVASGPSTCATADSGSQGVSGTVYVEANVAAPTENAILQYRYCNGSLLETVVARYGTGGTGSFDLGDDGILDADQQLVVNESQTLLFAVNQGSDSIAAFQIGPEGALTPVPGSPFDSGGPAPTSLGISGNILVVANKASDGLRNLNDRLPNYTTFTIAANGALAPTGTSFVLPYGSSPTQVYIAGGGTLVFTSEETGVLRGLQLSPTGALTLAPGSPVALPDSIFYDGPRPVPVWPAGLSSAPHGSVLWTGVPNYGSIASFSFSPTGELTLLSGQIEPEGSLPCWSVASADGKRLYFANAGSDNVSVWDTSQDPGHPSWLQTATLTGGGNPWGLRIDPSGTFLFVITPRQIRQIPTNEGQLLHALRIEADGTLDGIPGSPVPIPVGFDTNPLGVAVVTDR